MSVNRNSGRVVVDIDPQVKLALHAALAADGQSLKDWFVTCAHDYLRERRQPSLAFREPIENTAPPGSRHE